MAAPATIPGPEAARSPRGDRRRGRAGLDRAWWWGVFLGCALPLLALVLWAATGDLGANPIETVVRHLGDWALRLLILTLALTPLRHLTGSSRPVRYRRMIGLWAFAYVCLHVLAYVVVDIGLHLPTLIDDLTKRPYIMVGMAGVLTLIPLAATSTKGMIKRLGGRRWQRLHQLVYAAGILGAVHYLLMVKADITEPLVYIGLLVLLYGIRVGRWVAR
ncbi:sulfite oxidase heme-binding subunit YedZ [Roseospira marina]|uniref:sulfite oxidase heme-binding subunit YedZ n=1 Tax=Roseospira marina TaxID=140057 RepID=UPI0018281021|nr:protein-methionine-sulfoxide reductase heme-binding subunit MsrQ [Roseospira marina]MBB4315869.1 sulfoxide reductase heme-binding subunit YedZ [Roseospira marina]MBB5088991.1 sulfoxide reductase heme-binding subunit YedZ [Roseospira marina]